MLKYLASYFNTALTDYDDRDRVLNLDAHLRALCVNISFGVQKRPISKNRMIRNIYKM